MCSPSRVIRQQRLGDQQTKRQKKESQKLVERQERRIKRAVRSRAQGRRDSFSRQRAYVRDWQERLTKVKTRRRATETKFLKAITRSYVFFFFIGGQRA